MGEIVPSALLTGPNQMQFATALLPVVYVALVMFYPIAYPISVTT